MPFECPWMVIQYHVSAVTVTKPALTGINQFGSMLTSMLTNIFGVHRNIFSLIQPYALCVNK